MLSSYPAAAGWHNKYASALGYSETHGVLRWKPLVPNYVDSAAILTDLPGLINWFQHSRTAEYVGKHRKTPKRARFADDLHRPSPTVNFGGQSREKTRRSNHFSPEIASAMLRE